MKDPSFEFSPPPSSVLLHGSYATIQPSVQRRDRERCSGCCCTTSILDVCSLDPRVVLVSVLALILLGGLQWLSYNFSLLYLSRYLCCSISCFVNFWFLCCIFVQVVCVKSSGSFLQNLTTSRCVFFLPHVVVAVIEITSHYALFTGDLTFRR